MTKKNPESGNRKGQPDLVSSSEYHEYVPAITSIHVDKSYWGGLALNVYQFSKTNEGVAAPGIPDYGISYVTSAPPMSTMYSYGDSPLTPHRIEPETFQLVNRNSPMKWQWQVKESEDPATGINLILDAKLLNKVALETLDRHIADIELPARVDVRDGLMGELAHALKSEAENNTPLGKLYGETAAQLLAVHLLRKHCTVRHSAPEHRAGLPRGQLNKVREYIDACLDRDISLETLARLCGLSAYHFARMFKASTGLPPHRYIIERRVERARELLAHTTLPIIHIALEVGYGNHSHFASIFKKATGCTPREYRNRRPR